YVERVIALREVEYEATPYGAARFKTALVAAQDGTVRLRRPEYEDVARIAREQGLDFNKLYAELNG
ncbi:MAG TPA: TIGR00299 family protein, partial [Coriobacteriia bacterium]|nr:TIGR00299 family protein [Coriobacteriia bacterium]